MFAYYASVCLCKWTLHSIRGDNVRRLHLNLHSQHPLSVCPWLYTVHLHRGVELDVPEQVDSPIQDGGVHVNPILSSYSPCRSPRPYVQCWGDVLFCLHGPLACDSHCAMPLLAKSAIQWVGYASNLSTYIYNGMQSFQHDKFVSCVPTKGICTASGKFICTHSRSLPFLLCRSRVCASMFAYVYLYVPVLMLYVCVLCAGSLQRGAAALSASVCCALCGTVAWKVLSATPTGTYYQQIRFNYIICCSSTSC